jgi:hypothetical protein
MISSFLYAPRSLSTLSPSKIMRDHAGITSTRHPMMLIGPRQGQKLEAERRRARDLNPL